MKLFEQYEYSSDVYIELSVTLELMHDKSVDAYNIAYTNGKNLRDKTLEATQQYILACKRVRSVYLTSTLNNFLPAKNCISDKISLEGMFLGTHIF